MRFRGLWAINEWELNSSSLFLNFCTAGTVVSRWGLERKLICATTDQGANIKKALELYRTDSEVACAWLPCSSHKIQLCINKALDSSPGAKEVIEKCHKISTFFRKNPNAMSTLNMQQDKLFGRRCKLLSVAVTRWNSQYDMALRVLRIIDAINTTFSMLDKGPRSEKAKIADLPLSDQEKSALDEVLRVLKPMAEFTHWAGQNESLTIAQMYPKILDMISRPHTSNTEQAQVLRRKLDELLMESWPIESIPDAVLLAMFFNPACASLPIMARTITGDGVTLLAKAKSLATDAVVSMLRQHEAENRRQAEIQLGADHQDQAEQQTNNPEIVNALVADRFWRLQAQYAVDLYVLQLEIDPGMFKQYEDTPQRYWMERRTANAKAIRDVARSYLCIQATSTASERLLSKAGSILSSRKASLSDRNFVNIIFYHSFDRFKK
jgi:hypothetical protein